MSSDLDVARGVYAASATGDIAGVLAALSPDLHWTEAEGGPHGGVAIGPNKAVSFQQYTALQLRPLQA
jgi:ketosteroid isomerase-like protein